MRAAILPKRISRNIKFSKKWSVKAQSYFLERVSELIREGFSLSEALLFLKMMMEKEQEDIQLILEKMEEGAAFPQTLTPFGFSEQIVVQLHLSLLHGRFIETLQYCGEYLEQKQDQLKKLRKAAIYPSFLLFFALSMLFAIRSFLLPILDSSFLGAEGESRYQFLFFFIEYLPHLSGGFFLVISLGVLIGRRLLQKKNAIQRASFYSRLPIVGRWMIDYYTSFFSREFAYFYMNGQSAYQIVEEFKKKDSSLFMQQIALQIEEGLKRGDNLKDILGRLSFFRPELGWMIYQGELISQVGVKLRIFSQECHRSLLEDVEKKINLLQPILFLFIGLIVVLVYAVLMLPMLSMMGGMYS